MWHASATRLVLYLDVSKRLESGRPTAAGEPRSTVGPAHICTRECRVWRAWIVLAGTQEGGPDNMAVESKSATNSKVRKRLQRANDVEDMNRLGAPPCRVQRGSNVLESDGTDLKTGGSK